MCCDDPIEISCQPHYKDVVLPFVATVNHTVKTDFNGSVIDLGFVLNASNYPVIDKSLLNENYTHVIGIYNAAGANVACYKIKIHPSALCWSDHNISGDRMIADYANINSDTFLDSFVALGYEYGYRCIEASYNESYVDPGDQMIFDDTDVQRIPVQVAPRDTIPEHDTNTDLYHLSYDANWLTFLNSLPIAQYLVFNISPFCGRVLDPYNHNDHAYPSIIHEASLTNPLDDNPVYGKGFQIEWKKGAKFSFTIEFLYKTGETVEVGHTIIYTEKGYFINGGKEYPANLRIIKED